MFRFFRFLLAKNMITTNGFGLCIIDYNNYIDYIIEYIDYENVFKLKVFK